MGKVGFRKKSRLGSRQSILSGDAGEEGGDGGCGGGGVGEAFYELGADNGTAAVLAGFGEGLLVGDAEAD